MNKQPHQKKLRPTRTTVFLCILLTFHLALSVHTAHALGVSEQTSFRILDYFRPNIIAIDRGSSDSIRVHDHIRIDVDSSEDSKGFVARGLCVYTDLHHSFWKVYRLHRRNILVVNRSYKLTSLALSDANAQVLQEVQNTKWDYLKDKKFDTKDSAGLKIPSSPLQSK